MDSSADSTLNYSNVIDFCDSDDEDNREFERVEKDKNQQSDYEFVVLSRDGVIAEMLTGINEVVDILNVAEPFARVLLNKFKWNQQELIETYFDSPDLTKFFHEFHITNPNNMQTSNSTSNSSNDCGVCFSSTGTNSYNLQCGHSFCTECWAEYLKAKIIDLGNADVIECAEYNCGGLIDDQSVMELLDDSKVKRQYQILISNTFVLSHPLLRWCKTPDCEFAVKVGKIEPRLVMCECGMEQCFQCGEVWHEPVTCEILQKFIGISCADIETMNWLKKNTKQCPKCSVNIEKNGGCNHISCKSCRHEYCWVCMGPWRNHGGCNKYNQKLQENILNQARFSHYNLRYLNHNKSMMVELQLNSESKMCSQFTGFERLVYKRAVKTLHRSRRILMSTYVFAYFSNQSNQLFIFEANQNDLENATEKLSQYLEQGIANEDLSVSKGKIQDLRTYCDYRQKILLDHIQEGYEMGWWN